MAIRNIVKAGDDILRKRSRDVTVFDKRLHGLLDDMAQTLRLADGVGLAAVQVGVLRRAVLVDAGDGLIELINPKIIERSDDVILDNEGCLSFPQQYGPVERPRWVKVQAQNRRGDMFTVEGEFLKARAFCHELDHLDGVVFKDLVKRSPNAQKVTPRKVPQGDVRRQDGESRRV